MLPLDIQQDIAEAVSETFDFPVDDVFTADLNSYGQVEGQLLAGGSMYNYIASDRAITLNRLDAATAKIDAYAAGLFGFRADSVAGAYDYARGILRIDRKWEPCGSGYAPPGRCTKGAGKAAGGKVASAKGKLRSGGSKLKSGGAVVGGIAAGLGAAALAGAGGYAAYKGRKPLKEGAKAVGRELKAGAKEATSEVKRGIQEGKTIRNRAKQAEPSLKALTSKMSDPVKRRAAEEGARGAVEGGVAGAVAGGVESGIKAAKQRLKQAGSEAKKYGSQFRDEVFSRKKKESKKKEPEEKKPDRDYRNDPPYPPLKRIEKLKTPPPEVFEPKKKKKKS